MEPDNILHFQVPVNSTVEPDNILHLISEQTPAGFITNYSEFVMDMNKDKSFRPAGNLISSYKQVRLLSYILLYTGSFIIVSLINRFVYNDFRV